MMIAMGFVIVGLLLLALGVVIWPAAGLHLRRAAPRGLGDVDFGTLAGVFVGPNGSRCLTFTDGAEWWSNPVLFYCYENAMAPLPSAHGRVVAGVYHAPAPPVRTARRVPRAAFETLWAAAVAEAARRTLAGD